MVANILYMEDDRITAEMVLQYLRQRGYSVDIAENGMLGLEHLHSGDYQVVLSDYDMPVMNGLEVLEKLAHQSSLPVYIFLTGQGDESIAVEAMKLGAADYIVKDDEGKYLTKLQSVIERAYEQKMQEQAYQQAMNQVRESEKRYRDIFETNPAIQLILDPETGQITGCNQAALEFYGYDKDEFLEKSIFDIDTLDEDAIRNTLDLISKKRELHFSLTHRLKNGEVRHIDEFAGPISIGGKTLIYAIIQDVTTRVQMETRLHGTEEKFTKIFEQTHDGVCLLHANGTIETWNKGAEKITGFPASETIGKNIGVILYREFDGKTNEHQIDAFYEDLGSVVNGDTSYLEHESQIIYTKAHELRNVNISIFPIDTQRQQSICLMMHDVTEQVTAQQTLRAAKQKLRTLFESIADAVFILSQKNGRFLEVNTAACERYGYTYEEFETMVISDISAEPEKTLQELRTPNEYIPIRYHLTKSGKVFPAEITINAVWMDNEDVLVCTVRDISERLSLQQELERSIALLEIINDSVADAILVTDSEHRIQSFNKRFMQTWGVPHADTFNPHSLSDIAALFSTPAKPEQIQTALSKLDRSTSDTYGIVPFDDTREYEVHISPFFVRDAVAGKVWSFRDLTQRKHAEEQLRASQARFKGIFENASVGIAMIQEDGKFIEFNEQLTMMLGYQPDQLQTMTKQQVSLENEKNETLLRLRKIFNNECEGYRVEKRFIRNDGNIFWADFSVKAIRDSNGKVEAALAVLADISQQKHLEQELRKINNDLKDRNEELNAFAHSVAHDLKNPVSVIKGLAELLESDLYAYEPDELYEIISRIKTAGESMEQIIDALMLLSRVRDEEIRITNVDILETLTKAIAQLEPLIDRCNPVIHLPASMPSCLGYTPWIQIVWTNYISNALKYSGNTPIIHIRAEVTGGNTVVFSVQDNGQGIPETDLGRLFAPFQRLSKSGSGHGLGLSIVKRIVERLNGSVGVRSVPEGGTTFTFTLPLIRE